MASNDGAISECGIARRRKRRRSAAPVARIGILQPRSQPPCRRPANRGDGRISAHHSRHQATERRGRLHSSSHRLHRLQPSCRRGGWECVSRAQPSFRHPHPHQFHRRKERICALGARIAARAPSGRLQPKPSWISAHCNAHPRLPTAPIAPSPTPAAPFMPTRWTSCR